MVSIPGGEPLLHKEIKEDCRGHHLSQKIRLSLHECIIAGETPHLFRPTPYLTFSVHLDGLESHHDRAVDQDGVFKRAVSAIREAKRRGFRVNVNCTLFDKMTVEETTKFFDFVVHDLGVEGITVSPGYAYERAPNQDHFLNRKKTKKLFRDVFRRGKDKKWRFSQSSLFLDFLAGNQTYKCTPGKSHEKYFRVAKALLPYCGGLCPEFSGVDERD